ncbi:MAG: hypothetical protein WBC18_12095, partial [Ottowia sp.]|uniref:hypothetical protein n=1 Tax=Ottowia sp. TaxID=1898956 RepID=UPI003C71A303
MDGDTQVKCVSYHPTQIDMLRADAADMGTPLEDHEQQLADWVESYVPPEPEPPSVPQVVTRRQARRALALGGLLDLVQPAIEAIPDPTQRALAQIDWDDATDFRRDDATLLMLAAALGLTEEQLDDLFILAGEQP